MGERNLKKFQLLAQWMELKIKRISLKEFFEDRRITSIAIYGMAELGWLVYEELKADHARRMVKYGIDQRGSDIKGEIPIYPLDRALEKTDAIVITPVLIEASIEDEIYKMLGEQTLFTLEEILYELSRKYGVPSEMWRI